MQRKFSLTTAALACALFAPLAPFGAGAAHAAPASVEKGEKGVRVEEIKADVAEKLQVSMRDLVARRALYNALVADGEADLTTVLANKHSAYGDLFTRQVAAADTEVKKVKGLDGMVASSLRVRVADEKSAGQLTKLNALLEAAGQRDDHRRIGNRLTTVGDDFAFEGDCLRPLPAEPFPTWLTLTPRVDRYARVTVRQCQYSVPARLIGRRVRVQLGASQLLVFDGRVEVARHERCTTKGGQVLVLDNYLEVLLRKRGALPGASALAQARARGVFTATHDAFWAAARKALGDTAGTRALIEVLLLHRRLARHLVVAGIAAALSVGSVSPDVVAVEARKRSPDGVTPAEVPRGRGRVVSLPERRLADLPRDERPLPTVDAYDQLLTGTSEVTR